MRIACSRCEARYDLPEEKLDRGPVKIRCTRCGHVFAVRRRAEAPSAPPEPVAPLAPPEPKPASFDDFDFDAFGGATKPPPADAPLPAPSEAGFVDFDLDAFGRSASPAAESPSTEPPAGAEPAAGFEDFEFGTFEGSAPPGASPPPPEPPEQARAPAGFDDFDFAAFDAPAKAAGEPEAAPQERPSSLFDDELPSLGELDLGEFEESGGGLGLDEEPPHAYEPPPGEADRVRREDLISSAPGTHREVPVQGLTEEVPRLDLQKGPRRDGVSGKPSRIVARDRRRSPLTWAVVAVALAVGAWTGYNLWKHPEAFTFLSPSRIRALWHGREVETRFATEDVEGYAQNLPGGRRVFVVKGVVVNRSSTPQGLVRVRANLFAAGGGRVATREVYCGNVLSERELATLPGSAVEARLQNQVGEALSNVDIAPGSKVPFMVVFLSAPAGIETFNVQVTAARTGSGA